MANTEKTAAELLQEQLLMHPENIGILLSDEELEKAQAFCEDYKKFLDAAKTEREAVDVVLEMAQKAGYVPFDP